MATDPSSPLAQTTITTATAAVAIPIIDVELVSMKRDENEKFLQEEYVFIPEDYRARLTQKGLLDQLIELIRSEAKRHKEIKQQLEAFNISIPQCYYNTMIESGFIEPFIQLVNDVKLEQKVVRTKLFAQICQYQCEHEEDDLHDHIDADRTKRRRIEREDATTLSIIDSDLNKDAQDKDN
jgi:hypothetical protein